MLDLPRALLRQRLCPRRVCGSTIAAAAAAAALAAAAAEFLGKPATETTATDIANAVAETVDPMVDLQANADYRRQLVRVLGARVLAAAFDDATRQQEAA